MTQRSAAQGYDMPGMVWQQPVAVALDRHGPAALPFEPPSADFVEHSIYALFEIVATRYPTAIAVADSIGPLSFADLQQTAALLAQQIVRRVPPGAAVAVLLPNVAASVVGVLACLAGGRCCLVLNAEHPAERNAAILRNADVQTVIVQDDADPDIAFVPAGIARIAVAPAVGTPNAGSRIAIAPNAGARNAGTPTAGAPTVSAPTVIAAWQPTPAGPDEPAIVLYTSGSTGQPKGVVLSQATILARVRNNILSMHLHGGDRFLSLGALGTTAGLVASVIALLGGATQFITSPTASGVTALLSLIREERVTILWGVPALLRLLLEVAGARESLQSLRLVRTFGERLLRADLERWRAVLPASCHVAITYGQTEATIAQWFVPPGFVSDDAALPTGYLLPEHQYAVVDEAGDPVSDGDVGELVLRSRYVALGLWESGRCVAGQARQDASDPSLRILPTGDLVRLRPDGLLRVIGRADRQVKIRGLRVEPAEIEDTLRHVSGVTDAAVVAQHNGEDTVLLAFVVAGPPDDPSLLDRVRAAIRQTLPSYMQPVRVLAVERLPRLPGGKVNDHVLRGVAAATPKGPRPGEQYRAATPRTVRMAAHGWPRALDYLRRLMTS